jgi:hypothetical protein
VTIWGQTGLAPFFHLYTAKVKPSCEGIAGSLRMASCLPRNKCPQSVGNKLLRPERPSRNNNAGTGGTFPIPKIDNDLSALAALAHDGHQIASRHFHLYTFYIEW